MEEPSWMHPAESVLEGTPTSALTGTVTAGGSPERLAPGAAGDDVSSYALEAPAPPLLAPPAAVQPVAAAPPAFEQRPSAEHMVWTNEDGDIDALPWDMGGWSTGSSGEREQQVGGAALPPQGPQQQQAPAEPVDEDALIGALRRKASREGRLPCGQERDCSCAQGRVCLPR